ncbi:response regulator [Devosia sp.]|uniref:response regulator n=1 Tax=Devosia sp. TaxID=1871048 RepID=UPI002F183460
MRILIVDDEPLIRLGLMSLVEEWGYEADMAADAKSAIALMEQERFDLIITDVDMPGMDGIALAHYAASTWPPIRIIVVSGKITVDAASLPDGARFLAKPCSDTILNAAIAEMRPT